LPVNPEVQMKVFEKKMGLYDKKFDQLEKRMQGMESEKAALTNKLQSIEKMVFMFTSSMKQVKEMDLDKLEQRLSSLNEKKSKELFDKIHAKDREDRKKADEKLKKEYEQEQEKVAKKVYRDTQALIEKMNPERRLKILEARIASLGR
jgi:chromosome segregation ATPase